MDIDFSVKKSYHLFLHISFLGHMPAHLSQLHYHMFNVQNQTHMRWIFGRLHRLSCRKTYPSCMKASCSICCRSIRQPSLAWQLELLYHVPSILPGHKDLIIGTAGVLQLSLGRKEWWDITMATLESIFLAQNENRFWFRVVQKFRQAKVNNCVHNKEKIHFIKNV